jgi:GNAT superfamily N-acetyltransferase
MARKAFSWGQLSRTGDSRQCRESAVYAGRVIECVSREEIFELRWSVLRPGLPRTAAQYPQDADPRTFHLAARDPDGHVVGCGTFFPDPLDGVPAWRLRGMATEPRRQGAGIGSRLLATGVAEVATRGGRLLWCNGRAGVAGFYQRHGFEIRGDVFDIPPIGPHYIFVRAIPG